MTTHRGRSTAGRVGAALFFVLSLLYATAVHAACGCFGCLSNGACALRIAEPGDASPLAQGAASPPGSPYYDDGGRQPDDAPGGDIAAFRVRNRWGRTATHAGTSRGAPVTLTWGFVPDGTQLPSEEQEDGSTRNDPSDLIAFLDTNVGNGRQDSRVQNLEDKSWFPVIQSVYDRWSALSGVDFVYEPNDNGVSVSGSLSASRYGVLGTRADMRLSGHFIDGQDGPNTLAYNWYPSVGDMVIDTSNTGFFSNPTNNYVRLRNTMMHEVGHGLGIDHLESDNSGQLMEPFISTAFDGPQIDDILAVQRNYGDALEKGLGNDSTSAPTELGAFGVDDHWVIGRDGRSRVVAPQQVDFVSIEGSRDSDYYRFSVATPVRFDAVLEQVGRTYNEGAQGGDQSPFDASRQNDLRLQLLTESDATGVTTLASGVTQSDVVRSLSAELLVPGEDYFVRVYGRRDAVQLYELSLSFSTVPEPAGGALVALGGCALFGARRRAACRSVAAVS